MPRVNLNVEVSSPQKRTPRRSAKLMGSPGKRTRKPKIYGDGTPTGNSKSPRKGLQKSQDFVDISKINEKSPERVDFDGVHVAKGPNHEREAAFLTPTRKSSNIQELACIVPSPVNTPSSPMCASPLDFENEDLLNGSLYKHTHTGSKDITESRLIEETDKNERRTPSSAFVTASTINFSKKVLSLTRNDFTSDIAWQCLGAIEGKSIYWNKTECRFYDCAQLPQDEAYLHLFAPLIRTLRKIRAVLSDEPCRKSLYKQGLYAGIRSQLNVFEKDVTDLLATGSISQFSLISLNIRYLPIVQLLLRLLNDTTDLSGGKILCACVEIYSCAPEQCKLLISSIVSKVMDPLFRMLRSWLCDGEFNDPFNDFFIQSRLPMVEGGVYRWEDTFFIDTERAPPKWLPDISTQFPESVLNDILCVGKAVHFLRRTKVGAFQEVGKSIISTIEVDTDWSDCIRQRRRDVSTQLREFYENHYHIGCHIDVLIDVLLLQNGELADRLCSALMTTSETDSSNDTKKRIKEIVEEKMQRCLPAHSSGKHLYQMEVKSRTFQTNFHKKLARQLFKTTRHQLSSMHHLQYSPQDFLGIVLTTEICNGFAELHTFLLRGRLAIRLLEEQWRLSQSSRHISREMNVTLNRCLRFTRWIDHFLTVDILRPHLEALHVLIREGEVVQNLGFIEGMRWLLNGFVHNVQACFLLRSPENCGPVKLRTLTTMAADAQQVTMQKARSDEIAELRERLYNMLDLCVAFEGIQNKMVNLSSGIGDETVILQSLKEFRKTFDTYISTFLQLLDTEPFVYYKFLNLMRSSLNNTGLSLCTRMSNY